MNLIVNGFKETVPDGMTVSDLIQHLQELDPHLIVEVNGSCITPKAYDTCILKESDVVEFINPCFGG